MVEPVLVEAVSEADVEAVVRLLDAQLREHEISTPEAALRDVVAAVVSDERHGFMLLARSGAAGVGVAYVAAHLSAEHGGVIGWLEELYVAPEFRGRGIGASLLAEAISRAQQLHWRALELEVVAGHDRAAALYLRQGFVALSRTRYTQSFA